MREQYTQERAGSDLSGRWSPKPEQACRGRCSAAAAPDHAYCPRCGAPLPGGQDGGTPPRGGTGGPDLEALAGHPAVRPLLYVAGTIFSLVLIVEMARAVAAVAVVALIVFLALSWVRARERRPS